MSPSSRRIVVGVDGSSASRDAVRWAAATAAGHNLELHVVHALQLAELYYGGGMAGTGDLFNVVRQDADRVVQNAVAVARSVREDLAITTDCPVESPGSLLIDLSRDARMVVVGHTGRGGFVGMLVGATASVVAAHAYCPVAVIRGREGTGVVSDVGPVVVGIDGSPTGEQAIETAFAEASSRAVPLIAVHAWSDVTYDDTHGTARLIKEWKSLEEGEERVLAERLAGWQEKYPAVLVRRELVRDRPRHALLDWSATAQLIVVGSRGRGGIRGMLLGSTSQSLVQHAQCPVLVVRAS